MNKKILLGRIFIVSIIIVIVIIVIAVSYKPKRIDFKKKCNT